jgi:hypothetical protein
MKHTITKKMYFELTKIAKSKSLTDTFLEILNVEVEPESFFQKHFGGKKNV